MTDIDGNQLTTPEITVTAPGYFLRLEVFISSKDVNALWLNIYIVNELNRRLRDRLYFEDMDEIRRSPTRVGCCFNQFRLVRYCHFLRNILL